MANVKISGLPAASALDGTELVEIVQGGASKKKAALPHETILPVVQAATLAAARAALGVSKTGWTEILASGDATGVTDRAAVRAAWDALKSGGGVIYLPDTNYYFDQDPVLDGGNGVVILGRGGTQNCTTISFVGTSGTGLTLSNSNYCGIENILYYASAATPPTSGFGFVMSGCGRCWTKNFHTRFFFSHINVKGGNDNLIENAICRYIAGTYGILYDGTSGDPANRCVFQNPRVETPWPFASPTIANVKGNWATTTAYSQGDLVVANSSIWQCMIAGTSAGSGTGPSTKSFTANVTDGTAEWRFVMASNCRGIDQESYGNSFVLLHGVVIGTATGFGMTDTVASSSAPRFCYIHGIDIDHAYTNGMNLAGGGSFHMTMPWIGSTLVNIGMVIGSGWGAASGSNSFSVTGGRIDANARHGVSIGANLEGGFTNVDVTSNGQETDNTYDGYIISANVSHWHIHGGRSGTNAGTNDQRRGITVLAGTSDYYSIIGVNVEGNQTAAISDSGSGTNKRITGNPGYVTEAKGTDSIASGSTTKDVTHGLSKTPAAGDIWINFTEQGTNDYGRVWLSNIGATTFRVNVSADPGASNLDFAWGARVL